MRYTARVETYCLFIFLRQLKVNEEREDGGKMHDYHFTRFVIHSSNATGIALW